MEKLIREKDEFNTRDRRNFRENRNKRTLIINIRKRIEMSRTHNESFETLTLRRHIEGKVRQRKTTKNLPNELEEMFGRTHIYPS